MTNGSNTLVCRLKKAPPVKKVLFVINLTKLLNLNVREHKSKASGLKLRENSASQYHPSQADTSDQSANSSYYMDSGTSTLQSC